MLVGEIADVHVFVRVHNEAAGEVQSRLYVRIVSDVVAVSGDHSGYLRRNGLVFECGDGLLFDVLRFVGCPGTGACQPA